MRDANCVFCKILDGVIPSTKLYEDNDFAIILDIGPATFGHALVIPKNHYATIYEMLIVKSEDSTISVSGLSTQDTSSYFKRLASRYKPFNSGIMAGG